MRNGLILSVYMSFLCFFYNASASVFYLQNDHSQISWNVTYLKKFKVAGVIPLQSGSVDFSAKQGQLFLDLTGIFSGNKMRDHHLRKEDFFHTELFPTIEVKMSEINLASDGSVSGMVTFFYKNETFSKPLKGLWSGPVTDPWQKKSWSLTGSTLLSLKELQSLLQFRWNPDLIIEDQLNIEWYLQWQTPTEFTASSHHLLPSDAKARALKLKERDKVLSAEAKIELEAPLHSEASPEVTLPTSLAPSVSWLLWISYVIVFCTGLWGVLSLFLWWRFKRDRAGKGETQRFDMLVDLMLLLAVLAYLFFAGQLLPS